MKWMLLWLWMMLLPAVLFGQEGAQEPPRQVPAERWEALRKHEDFWYSREPWKEDAPVEIVTRPAAPGFWKNLMLVLFIMGSLALLYSLIQRLGLFGLRGGKIGKGSREEEVPEDGLLKDYRPAIREAVARGDYRAALRLNYLQVLAALAGAGHIRWDEVRTDREYGQDLEGTPYEEDWKRLSRMYAWSWYGRHPLPEPLYAEWAPQFDQLLGRIRP